MTQAGRLRARTVVRMTAENAVLRTDGVDAPGPVPTAEIASFLLGHPGPPPAADANE